MSEGRVIQGLLSLAKNKTCEDCGGLIPNQCQETMKCKKLKEGSTVSHLFSAGT